jgi:hypothetical protein
MLWLSRAHRRNYRLGKSRGITLASIDLGRLSLGSIKGSHMKRFIVSAIVLSLAASTGLHAEDSNTTVISNFNAPLNDVKAKIFDANIAARALGNGTKFCNDLDGTTTFYFAPRDRVLNLADYHRSLENLAREAIFNPETKKPWTEQDAGARWDEAQKDAVTDKANCDLFKTLPDLQKQLQDLESKSQASGKPN